MKISKVLLLLFTAAVCCGTEKQGVMNSILASVNGVPISLQDVLVTTREKEFRAAAASSGEELKKQILQIRRRAVDDLIDRKLILEDYAGKKFEIAERDIENALDEIAERMGSRSRTGFELKLRRQGSSVDEVRKHVRETMIVQLMLHREYMAVRSVTPEMMYQYYQKKQRSSRDSGSIELAMILLNGTDSKQIQLIADELKKDPSQFSALASKWSSGPGREDGGKLGRIDCSLLRPEFAEVLVKPEKDRIYGPLKTTDGTIFLKVLQYNPPKIRSFKDEIPEIRKQLEAEQRRESRKKYTQFLRKNAIIRYFF